MTCILCQANLLSSHAVCDQCASYPEDRAFAAFFRAFARPESPAKILDVAPPAPQLAYFAQPKFLGEGRYTAIAPIRLPEAENVKAPHRFLEMDVTHLSFSDSSFDIIVCNHVLSYVRSDFLAMSELHRCLKAQGMAFLNVSVAPGKSRRESMGTGSIGSGREWSYGEDYFERLEAAGLFVMRLPLRHVLRDLPEASGIQDAAEQVICFKFRDAMERFQEKLAK